MMFVEQSKSSDGLRAISNEEVVSYCVTLLLAGYESLASTLTYTSYLLALNLRAQEKLCAEIDLFFKSNPVIMACYELLPLVMYRTKTGGVEGLGTRLPCPCMRGYHVCA